MNPHTPNFSPKRSGSGGQQEISSLNADLPNACSPSTGPPAQSTSANAAQSTQNSQSMLITEALQSNTTPSCRLPDFEGLTFDTSASLDPLSRAFVFRGKIRGMSSAIKRLPEQQALRELEILLQVDRHRNVISCYSAETRENFTYIALELCDASLDDLISSPDHPLAWRLDKVQALREIILGIKYLHKRQVVHGNLKPRNILVSSVLDDEVWMVISDFSQSVLLEDNQKNTQSQQGMPGWIAPEGSAATETTDGELKVSRRLEKSVDIYSFGHLLCFILTNGKHAASDIEHWEGFERDREATDIIKRTLVPEASQRPDATTTVLHPFFWDARRRLAFLRETSTKLYIMFKCDPSNATLLDLDSTADDVIGTSRDWLSKLDPRIASIIPQNNLYDGRSVAGLLRAIRYIYLDFPPDAIDILGPSNESFLGYFSERFPALLMHTYTLVSSTHLHKELALLPFFGESPE